MTADERRLRVVLIEDDAPLMRLMSWALTDEGFDVTVLSRRDALEQPSLGVADVAVFNMKATAWEKTLFNRNLRHVNPDITIVDVDEFVSGGGSERDSGADSYTPRPLNVEALLLLIKEQLGLSAGERQDARDVREQELRPQHQPDDDNSE